MIILGVLAGVQLVLLYLNPNVITATSTIVTTLMLVVTMLM